jgi:raffinose/stachyose/melibiose transport system permease protein
MSTSLRTRDETSESRDRAPRPGARRSRQLTFGHWWWALPGILLVLAIHYVATSVGGFFAFTNWSGIGDFSLVGFDNFVKIFEDPTKLGSLLNTLFLAFGSVVLSNIAGLVLGLGLNRGIRSRYVLRVLFFMPVVLSPLAVSYIWKFIFDYNGPINLALKSVGLGEYVKAWVADPGTAIWTVLIVLVWQNTGIAMVIYIAGLSSIPIEVEAIDGATLWQRCVHVTLPGLRPAIAISTTLGLVNGLRVFDQIMALTGGGPAGATETLATQVYKESFALGNFGYGAALALVLTVIILVFAVIQQRATSGKQEGN